MIDREVFNKSMDTLCKAYKENITEDRAKIYYDVLTEKFDNDDMTYMLPIVLRRCKYFPSIADITEAIYDIDYTQELK